MQWKTNCRYLAQYLVNREKVVLQQQHGEFSQSERECQHPAGTNHNPYEARNPNFVWPRTEKSVARGARKHTSVGN